MCCKANLESHARAIRIESELPSGRARRSAPRGGVERAFGIREVALPSGFTLVEILVALTILAVVMITVLPIVVGQLHRADPVAAAGDLARAGNAVRYFQLNTRAFPGDFEDLARRPDPAEGDGPLDPFLSYSSTQIAAWNGPYIHGPLEENGIDFRDAYESGFDVTFQVVLACVSPESSNFAPCEAGKSWVAIEVNNVLASEFEAINDIIDGEAEDDDNFDTNGRTESRDKGRLRLVPDLVVNPEFQVNQMVYLIMPYMG